MNQFIYNIVPYFAALAVSGGLALALTPYVRRLAIRFRWFDVPNGRSSHSVPIPRVGGLAILSAYLIGVVVCIGLMKGIDGVRDTWTHSHLVILVGGGLMASVGLYDDLRGMRAWVKLALQILIAVFTVHQGVAFDLDVAMSHSRLAEYSGVVSSVLSVFWIIVIVNAINLTDGLDGLAGGISAIAMAGLYFVLACAGVGVSPVIAFALVGACLGFLYHNYHPASIFMGDTGSLFLGYTLAAFPLPLHLTHANLYSLLAIPLCILYLPIFDVVSCSVRRILEKRSPFSADKLHLHHRIYNKHENGQPSGYKKTIHRLYGLAIASTFLAIIPLTNIERSTLLISVIVAITTMVLLLKYGYLNPLFEAWKRHRAKKHLLSGSDVADKKVAPPAYSDFHSSRSVAPVNKMKEEKLSV
ncbi:MAG: undecaprenyl/decaprenyl-phosphate alpha-N-acetylglucosaminyl 1-phosphate transferase [Opitutales bacterium]|nr:undecaprenyl/decaprenyl-phosphate alpha-N-acetylglucosaminyl 1-phosphate transferase [Opitutales bacterium]